MWLWIVCNISFSFSWWVFLSWREGGPSRPQRLTSPKFLAPNPCVNLFPSTARCNCLFLGSKSNVGWRISGWIWDGRPSEDLDKTEILGMAKLKLPLDGQYFPHTVSLLVTWPQFWLPERNLNAFPFDYLVQYFTGLLPPSVIYHSYRWLLGQKLCPF